MAFNNFRISHKVAFVLFAFVITVYEEIQGSGNDKLSSYCSYFKKNPGQTNLENLTAQEFNRKEDKFLGMNNLL